MLHSGSHVLYLRVRSNLKPPENSFTTSKSYRKFSLVLNSYLHEVPILHGVPILHEAPSLFEILFWHEISHLLNDIVVVYNEDPTIT